MYILDTIYDDYEITYQTNINEHLVLILILLGIVAAFIIVYFVAMMRINKKANRSGISALVPFYNIVVLLNIVNEPTWKFILALIPGINIIYFWKLMYQLARYFRKDKTFRILTAIFPFIMLPIIAFSDSEYIGINEEAMKGTSVAKELPIETKKQPTLTRPDQPMKERMKVSMSIGGGVYQKEYRDSLLETKNAKEVKKPEVADFRVDTSKIVNEQQVPNAETIFQNVNFIEENTNKVEQPQVQSQQVQKPVIETVQSSNTVPSKPVNLLANSSNLDLSVIPTNEKIAGGNFIDSSSSIIEKPLNDNVDSSKLSFVAPIIEEVKVQEEVSQNNPIPNQTNSLESKQQNESAVSLSFQINPQVQGLNDQELKQQAEFIACKHCGAMVKNGSKRCFMCGKEL